MTKPAIILPDPSSHVMDKQTPSLLMVPMEKHQAIIEDRNFWKAECLKVQDDLPDYIDQ